MMKYMSRDCTTGQLPIEYKITTTDIWMIHGHFLPLSLRVELGSNDFNGLILGARRQGHFCGQLMGKVIKG